MKIVYVVFLCALVLAFSACQKTNDVSKIPHIGLIAFLPLDSMIANIDTCSLQFSLIDGDGDIGYANPGGADTVSQIYMKDSRFDSAGFQPTPFPAIDVTIEDPKKGLQGTCLFFPFPQPIPRPDSLHTATGDTLTYELYIKDRAGHESNHIITGRYIIRP